jgi:BMFP domain-containing protein YqiC
MNTELELRNLLGEGPAGVKSCSVCGKPESRNTKQVNTACPAHALAIAEDLPSKFRMVTRALGSNYMDFVQRKSFNAQLESIRAKLIKAREEHDAFTPESDQANTGLRACGLEMLAMVGVASINGVCPAAIETPTRLAEALRAELTRLGLVKAEVDAIEVSANLPAEYKAGAGI